MRLAKECCERSLLSQRSSSLQSPSAVRTSLQFLRVCKPNGRVEVGFGSLVQTLPQARSGKLKVIGVSTQKRSPLLPNVPTIAESGLPGYDDGIWWGVLGPAGLPGSIVNRLNSEIGAIMSDPDMVKRLEGQGADPVVAPPEAFAKLYASQIAKWARVAKEAGIRSE